MLSARNRYAQRWLHRCGLVVLPALVWGCNSDSPISPSSPPGPSVPASPAPRPPTPSGPGSAKLTLSRPDVVFNAAAGATPLDSATVSVTATSIAITELRAIPRYADGQPDGWLTAALDHSTLPATLTLTTGQTPLPPGEYAATVELKAAGAAPESVTVTRRVVTGAAIGLNAAKICFTTTLGDTTHRDDVRVTSVDGSVIDGLTATIVYDAGQPTGWLSDSFNVSAAPARLWLKGSPGSLPIGTYTATVNVASPKAGNSPVPIRVTMTVNEGPGMLHIVIRRTGNWVGKAKVYGPDGLQCFELGYPPEYQVHVCDKAFRSGSQVKLSSEGDYGERFLRWEGPCTVTYGYCAVEMPTPSGDVTITAVFGPKPDERTLKLQVTGPGSIWSGDVQCSNLNCAYGGHYYPLGDIVRLDPLPDLGAKLVRWTGCPVASDTACFMTMTEDRVVGAEFAIDAGARTLEVGVLEECDPGCVSPGAGSVSSADGGIIDCNRSTAPCRQSYPLGTVVHLTATGIPGTTFLGWTGCPSPTGMTCDVPMTEARTVVAAFTWDMPPPPAPAGNCWSNLPVLAGGASSAWMPRDRG